jgi:hypothetical protein
VKKIKDKWLDIKESRDFAEFKRHWLMCALIVAFLIADKAIGSPPFNAREIVLLIAAVLSIIRSIMEEV